MTNHPLIDLTDRIGGGCPDALYSDGCRCTCPDWPGRKCPANPRRKANWVKEGADLDGEKMGEFA